MDPVVGGSLIGPLVGIPSSIVSGIAQAYTAAEARKANQQELDRIRALFESIVPPEYDISVNDPPDFIEGQLKGANLDFSAFTPENFKVLQQYAPQAAAYVAEQNPTLVQGSALAREGRSGQAEAFREYQKMARGESPELQVRLAEANRNSQAQAQQRSQSALSDAARRGTAGGGLEFASQLQGSSDSMARGAQNSQSAALAAYQAKMDAVRQSGQMGRELAGDELSQEAQNAQAINSFNQRTSRNYQDYLNQQATLANEAQRLNIGQNQQVANANTAQSNDAQKYNRENKNNLAMQSYGMQRDERNYADNIAAQKAQWAANEKNRQNQLKSQGYDDKFRQAQGMSGIGQMQMGQNNQAAQDKNAAIQGVTNTVNAGAATAGNYYQNKENQDRADARYDKYFGSK